MLHKRGLTLVELIMAMSITCLVGLVVATLAVTLSTSYRDQDTFQQAVQDGRDALGHIGAITRKAKLVTAVADQTIVYWTGDANGDGEINRDELAMIQYDHAAGKVLQCRIALGSGDANPVLALSQVTSAAGAAALLEADSCRQWDLLAQNVQEFHAAVSPAAPKAKDVTVSMKVGQGSRVLSLQSTTLLRADATAAVGLASNQWVLGQGGSY